jgi:uncharacterized protein YkwD
MTKARALAASVLTTLLVGAGLIWGGPSQGSPSTVGASADFPRPTPAVADASTTTSIPDLEALVASGAVGELSEFEKELTDQALDRVSSTTVTTDPSSPTTSQPSGGATSPSTETPAAPTTTAPPTTQPPETSPPGTVAAGYDAAAESDFASRINGFRGSSGQSALSRDGSLDSHARSWAKRMAGDGALSHSDLGSLLPPWATAGENVGMGGSVGAIFDALVASSSHQANMLGDFTHMGIGTYRDSNGVLWTAHVFAR